MRSFFNTFYLLFIICVCHYSAAQSPKSVTISKIEKKLKPFETNVDPGLSLLVVKNGAIVYSKNTGLANLENRNAISEQTVFRVASLSKQFTAACILILEEKGLLSLEDPLDQYFPEFPDYASKITLRHLIHHTSGIRDFFKLADLSGFDEQDFNSEETVLKMITRQKKLVFEPGTDMLYNNSGYFLLGMVVKKVSGLSIDHFAKAFVFKPLSMENTSFFSQEINDKKDRALGYKKDRTGDNYELYDSDLIISGDGGLFTTTEDLVKWDLNFYNNKLPIKNFAARMYTRGRLKNGNLLDYSFGLEHSSIMEYDCIEHSGAYVGFRSALLRIPAKELSVICIGNSAELQAAQICRKIADIILSEAFADNKIQVKNTLPKTLPFERTTVKLPSYVFTSYKGKYELANGQILNFYNENERYYVDIIGQTNIEVFPSSSFKFFVKETDISFSFVLDSSKVTSLVILHIGDKKLLAKRIVEGDTSSKILNEYVGAYYNEDLDVTYKLIIEEDGLFIQIDNKPKTAIDLIRKDKMILGEGLAEFHRDKQGNISAFYLEAGSVKDLLFVKE